MNDKLIRTAQAVLKALEGHEPRKLHAPQSRRASVLVPLVDRGRDVEVLFTKRTNHLPHHPGQISFPGGASDPEDNGSSFTALRETCEEIGVCEGLVQVVVRLDQVLTVTDFLVTPYLGLVDPDARFAPNPVEVDHLIMVPLAKVLDQKAWGQHEVHWQDMSFMQEGLIHGGEIIWGATARMLLNLRTALGVHAQEVISAASAEKGMDSKGGLG